MSVAERQSVNPLRPLPDLTLPLNPARIKVVEWARRMLEEGCILFDSETVGLNPPLACEVALVYLREGETEVLMNERVRPKATPEQWTEKAIETHGIRPEDVEHCREFPVVYLDMLRATSKADHLVIYNRDFDLRVVRASMGVHGYRMAFAQSTSREGALVWHTGAEIRCAMKAYSLWVGKFKTKKNGQSYGKAEFQKLPDYGHSAHTGLGDCLSTADLIRDLASVRLPGDGSGRET